MDIAMITKSAYLGAVNQLARLSRGEEELMTSNSVVRPTYHSNLMLVPG